MANAAKAVTAFAGVNQAFAVTGNRRFEISLAIDESRIRVVTPAFFLFLIGLRGRAGFGVVGIAVGRCADAKEDAARINEIVNKKCEIILIK